VAVAGKGIELSRAHAILAGYEFHPEALEEFADAAHYYPCQAMAIQAKRPFV